MKGLLYGAATLGLLALSVHHIMLVIVISIAYLLRGIIWLAAKSWWIAFWAGEGAKASGVLEDRPAKQMPLRDAAGRGGSLRPRRAPRNYPSPDTNGRFEDDWPENLR